MSIQLSKTKPLALILALSLITGMNAPFVNTGVASAAVSDTLTSSVLADKAVNFINKQYQNGEEIDGYTSYVLALTGQQLGAAAWSKDGESLQQKQSNLSDLLGNSNLPVQYILANQTQDGSFKPYADALGTRAILQSLAKVQTDIAAADPLSANVKSAIAKSVNYFQTGYQQAKWDYSASGDLDYRTVQALHDAGEDLSSARWTVNSKSLKQAVLESATKAANSADTKTADLAKQLIAVAAVSPDDQLVKSLADAIIVKKTEKDSTLQFGSSIYEDVVVLQALAKAGRLTGIDQAKALAYLNTFKHEHAGAWGPAGAAWGSYAPEESDLTAQVLQVLGSFDQSGDNAAVVKQSIADGFKYLQDIQNKDTGAIAHEFDSTFTTAETLLAIQANGNGYKTYNSSASGWVFSSKTKTIAQLLLAAVALHDTERVNRLSQLLLDRHTANSFENSVYSDMWAYIALGEAGKLAPIAADARAYILKKQSIEPATKGVWGETYDKFYPDFLSTTQAIRALTYLPGYQTDADVQAAITSAFDFIKNKQQADGGVYNPSEDAVVDTAEAVISLKKAGKNPNDWKNTQGKTPVNYLLEKAANTDGSIGTVKNSFAAAEALYAYYQLGTVAHKPFADVTAALNYGWATNAVEVLGGAGIVNGVGENQYEPGRSISRAEFAAILTRLIGVRAGTGSAATFPDVQTGQWYSDAVAAAAAEGWIRGYEDHTFRPNNPISRQEMAVMLVRANQWQLTNKELNFKDKQAIEPWATGEVSTVTDKGLVTGFDDQTFRPKANASRAEAAVMLYRMAGTR